MSNINELFVPYAESLKLKALGFDEPCFAFYEENNNELVTFYTDSYQKVIGNICLEKQTNAPTFSQAFKWFREKYGWVSEIHGSLQENKFYANILWQGKALIRNIKLCNTYEEAELACLHELIKIVKNETN